MEDSSWTAYVPSLLAGLGLTLALTATSMVFGGLLGLALALMTMSRSSPARLVASIYGTLVRGMPLLVQILFVFFGLPALTGIRLPAVVAGGISMALYTAGFLAETIRAGVQSVDKGQMEAGRSVGFGHWQTMRLIIMPQALRSMLPNLVNQFSITLKNTSLLSVIGVTELTMAGQSIYSLNFDMIRVLTMVAVLYLAVYLIFERISLHYERRIVQ